MPEPSEDRISSPGVSPVETAVSPVATPVVEPGAKISVSPYGGVSLGLKAGGPGPSPLIETARSAEPLPSGRYLIALITASVWVSVVTSVGSTLRSPQAVAPAGIVHRSS